MRHWKVGSVSLMILALAISGCAKKTNDQASITGTGFDAAITDDLTQLPQSTPMTSQQAGIETLPVETSPITQGMSSVTGPAATGIASPAASNLTREQQIQTALRNAGLYSGNIDGKIGPASKRAIEEFQRNNGLKADGKVGPKTWAALEPYVSGSAPAQASTLEQ
jgi:peptidoglycan hydrolase-like protein with peptidoglycan-binding domain